MRKASLLIALTAVSFALIWATLQTLRAMASAPIESVATDSAATAGTPTGFDDVTPVEIIDLGTLGGSTSTAVDIDNAGRIAGTSATSGDLGTQAFVWQAGTMTPLNTPDGQSSTAVAIGGDGRVVGHLISRTNGLSDTLTPVIWVGGVISPLQTLSETRALVADINAAGLMAGHTLSDTVNELLIWQADATLSATVPLSPAGSVAALGDRGAIAGTRRSAGGDDMAFLWRSGSFTDLGTLGGSSSTAFDVNQYRQIVGTSAITDDVALHAFLWQDGIMLDLGLPDPLPDAPITGLRARGINNAGTVVGDYTAGGETHAFVWQGGEMVALQALLPENTPWERLTTAVAINDGDWIAGTGIIGGGEHAYLIKLSREIRTAYLPLVIGYIEPVKPGVDVGAYLIGDGRLYEVRHSQGSQARHQTQFEGNRYYHTKGNEFHAEWEELWNSGDFVYRGTDTSPGNGEYYTLYDNNVAGSKWAPRFWKVGDIFERNPLVVYFDKNTCNITRSGTARTWLRFVAIHDSYTFDTGLTIRNVVQLAWLLSPDGAPEEEYFYSPEYGLVGWGSRDRGYSAISEIHPPGARPDNKREVISCRSLLETEDGELKPNPAISYDPLPIEYFPRK